MSSRTDPQPPDRSARGSVRGSLRMGDSVANAASSMAVEAGAPEGIDLLEIIGRAEQLSKDYQSRLEPQLSRAYRAYNNEHAMGSKYLGPAFRGRSRLFVPKTRAAVRKNQATTVGAFFATDDVINVSAEYQDDPIQQAAAATMKAAMEIRMTRSSLKSGMPWYSILAGASLDAARTGIVISKQHWRYEEVPSGEFREVLKPAVDEEGKLILEPVLDPMTGMERLQPVMETGYEEVMRVIEDRPMITVVPIENVYIDPSADWTDPAQMGRWFIARYPMGLSDVRSWMASAGKAGADPGWLPNVPDELLLKGRIDEDRSGSRRVREGGGDRYQDARAPGQELDIVFVQENFIRISGVDYHFWSVGRFGYLSKVRPVWEAYPELNGERPYILGVSQIDSHRVFPMSPVESWQPLQLEINDVTNLRQDTLKRAIAPLTVVKAGTKVDHVALQRRGQPEATITVNDPAKDIVFQPSPGPTGAAYTETSVNSAMFDELAGVFSTSSVMSSRQLNETATGMNRMAGAANAVSEYDLRTFVETWAERALRQILHLVRKLESDERILAAAGRKARVMEEFGTMPSLSDWDATEVMLRVNAGIGALDPMQKLAKLRMAGEMLAPMAPGMMQEGIKPNYKELIAEVMGAAGYKDGMRFWEFGEPPQQGQDPELQKMMLEIQAEQQRQARDLQASLKELILNLRSDELQTRENNQTKLLLEQMKGRREVLGHMASAHESHRGREHEKGMAREGRDHEARQASESRFADRQDAREARASERESTREGRRADREDAREAREHEARQAEEDRRARAAGGGKGGKGGGGRAPSQPRRRQGESRPEARSQPAARASVPDRQRVVEELLAGGRRGLGAPAPRPGTALVPAGAEFAQPGQGVGQGFGQPMAGPGQGAIDPRRAMLMALMQQLARQGAPGGQGMGRPQPGAGMRPNAF